MSLVNITQVIHGRKTREVKNFGKYIQCKFCEFEWFRGQQALNIQEKLCEPYQKMKQEIVDLKKENLPLRVDYSTFTEKNVVFKETID